MSKCTNCGVELNDNNSWMVELIIYTDEMEPWKNELYQNNICINCAKNARVVFD